MSGDSYEIKVGRYYKTLHDERTHLLSAIHLDLCSEVRDASIYVLASQGLPAWPQARFGACPFPSPNHSAPCHTTVNFDLLFPGDPVAEVTGDPSTEVMSDPGTEMSSDASFLLFPKEKGCLKIRDVITN
jgi:hypothetical protein